MKKLNCSLRTLRASGRTRTAVMILAGGMVTVILLALLYRSHVTFEKELTATFQRHQLTTARSLAAGVEEVFAEVKDDLRALARHKDLLSQTAPPQDEIDAYYQTHTDILNNITVVDAEGNAITRSPKTAKKHNVSRWPEFLGAKETGRPWIGESAKCVIDPTETVVRIFAPVVANGRFNGAIYASINLKKLWAKCIKHVETGRESFCWVVDQGGMILYHADSRYLYRTWAEIEQENHADQGPGDAEVEDTEAAIRKRVQQGQEGTVEFVSQAEGGWRRLTAFTPIRLGNRTYGLAVVTLKSQISAPIAAHAKVTYVLMAGLAVLCVAGGYVVYRGGRARVLLAEEKKHANALRQSEEALGKSEKQYRTLVESLRDGVYRLDRQGRFAFVNDVIVERSGRPGEWFIGRSYLDVIVPEDRQRMQEIFAATMRGESTQPCQTAYRTASGELLHIEANSSPLFEGDEVVGLLGVSRNITEHRRAEEEIADLAKFPSENPYPVLRIAADGEVLYANVPASGLLQDLGYSVAKPAPEQWRRIVAEAIQSSSIRPIEVEHNGRVLAFRAVPVPDGGYVNWYGVEITERKQAEQELANYRGHLEELVEQRTAELKVANKELESFSYSVSHDLRTPLRGITGFSQALKEECADKLGLHGKDYLDRVLKGSGRMTELIDDLLRLSGVTLQEMKHETVDLSALAQSIAGELQKAEPARQVRFAVEPGLTARGDAALLRLALQNLMSNAWKFTGMRGRAKIEFGALERNGAKTYFVRDDGVGFDMAYVDKLFVPFQRLHPRAEFSGTGIGLATVSRIIGRHGGKVWGEGQAHKGATFYFSF